MSPRGKQHANGRTGLWQDLPGQGPVPAHDLRIEEQTSPLLRECPACKAAPRQRCTPLWGGRKPLRGYHDSRLHPSKTDTRPVSQEQP